MNALIRPAWPTSAKVGAAFSTRLGGVSEYPWATLNVGLHVGDDPAHVDYNRELLLTALGLASAQNSEQPQWLNQVHGSVVVEASGQNRLLEADACISRVPGRAAVVMTADCLPILICDQAGTVVAAVHAGWRSLAAGIVRNTIVAMGVAAAELEACLGPAISQAHFEVGPEVAQMFLDNALSAEHKRQIATHFVVSHSGHNKQCADLYGLARAELRALGVENVSGGDYCTFQQKELFFSYRRDGESGRMASLVWLK